jgi:hypothetical protein
MTKPSKKSALKSKARKSKIASNATTGLDTSEYLGADTSALVTQSKVRLAIGQLGSAPRFWGRYFKGPGDESPIRYQAHFEGAVLRKNTIRVLPIAQQTNHVNGNADLGSKDGLRNAAAIIASFGQTYLSRMDGVFVFLDVEGPPRQSLVEEYYRAWSDAIIAAGKNDMIFRDIDKTGPINFWPCVYGAEGDDQTWNSLFAAVKNGAVCQGTWIARPGKIGCQPLALWDDKFIRPKSLPTSVRILLWQGVQECESIDYNRANPATAAELMSGLVSPPDMETEWLLSSDVSEEAAIS